MHFYSLIVVAIGLQKVSSADWRQPSGACNPLHTAPAVAALHIAFIYTSAALETIVPTVSAMMPDKAPLVIGAWTGCNALALRVSYSRSTLVPGEQVSS